MKIRTTTKITISDIEEFKNVVASLNLTKHDLREVIDNATAYNNPVLSGLCDAIQSATVNALNDLTASDVFEPGGAYIVELDGVSYSELLEYIYGNE